CQRVPAVPGLPARPVQGIFRAVVRHAQGGARLELRQPAGLRAPALPQLLPARPGRHVHRLQDLRVVTVLTSKDNPKVKRWIRLATDARYRRSEKRALIEGPHLLAAALQAGLRPITVLATEAFTDSSLLGEKPVMLGKGVFRAIVE